MASISLITYSRYLFVRQSGLKSALRITGITSKSWNPAPVSSTAELTHRHSWVRNYAVKKKSGSNKNKKALDDFLEEFDDDDEDDEPMQRRPEVIGGKETAVAKFVRECQSGKGRGKKDAKGMSTNILYILYMNS